MGAPYVAAHNATKNPDNGYPQQETVDAIANLATATASDRTIIAQLTATVARLMTELATLNEKLVDPLQAKCVSRGSRRGHVRTTCGQGARSRAGAGTGDGAGAAERTRSGVPTLAQASIYLEPPIY